VCVCVCVCGGRSVWTAGLCGQQGEQLCVDTEE
jgi:hypothetical protein